MKKAFLLLLFAAVLINGYSGLRAQGFSPTYTQWNIPSSLDDENWKVYDSYQRHELADMNGDGKPDLIDGENEATTGTSDVFKNGSQKYWKVYINTGTGFSSTATQWNIPANVDDYDWKITDFYSRHGLIDMDGDGKADLVDSENEATTGTDDIFKSGNQKYWKVYLNTGSGFSSTATQWNMPANVDDYDWKLFDSYARHMVMDFNGDGKPDLIDSENEATTATSDIFKNGNQKYWKVYLNTGTGFSSTATQWNMPASLDDEEWKPYDSYSRHELADMDGDNKPDLVDGENEATTSTSEVFKNGNQKHWKVYFNTGSGFSATATQWNIPASMEDDDWKITDFYSRHAVLDINGDNKADLLDGENEATASTSEIFKTGNQKYWKIYMSTGSGFSSTATQWNMPANVDDYDWKIYDSYLRHTVLDMNGDDLIDLVDSENEGTTSTSDVFTSGNQKYWKIYLNNTPLVNAIETVTEGIQIKAYPNPVAEYLTIQVSNITPTTCRLQNTTGQTVLTSSFENGITTMYTGNLCAGVYFVYTEGLNAVIRIVKQ